MSNRVILISDFNIEILGRILENDEDAPSVDVELAPYGQVQQVLASPPSTEREPYDAAIVWTRPSGVNSAFSRLASRQTVSEVDLLFEVDEFADLVRRYKDSAKRIIVANWCAPDLMRGLGILDYLPGTGIAWALARMNLRLAEQLADEPDIYVIESERWLRVAGPRAYSAKSWFATKVPFTNLVFQEAAADIKAAVFTFMGRSKKLILVDLDNTLWGGIIGETGPEGIILGGHDTNGEAFVAFQEALKALTQRGVQLGIVSKNDESVALQGIGEHSAMVLRQADFAGWRINWEDKAANIVSLVEELNLGLDSVVFLDDNPAERGRVREALPDILVPDLPPDPALFAQTLMELRCFDVAQISKEDVDRVSMYRAERQRRTERANVSSTEDWLRSLDIRIEVERFSPVNEQRIVQLIGKTNQLNLSTRRLSVGEIRDWLAAPNRALWSFKVTDRFGDMGLTGIISVEVSNGIGRIVDFILSCRVMGRNVEEVMVHTAVQHAMEGGADKVQANFLPTERNRPCLDFWTKSGFAEIEENLFEWPGNQPYPYPSWIDVVAVSDTKVDLDATAQG